MSEPDRFAFGDDSIGEYPCPVVASGRPVAGLNLELAELYDSKVEGRVGRSEGTVNREIAEEAWTHAIDFFRARRDKTDDPKEREHYDSIVQQGIEIHIELFE